MECPKSIISPCSLAALSAFVLGGLWYSPCLFAKKWMAYTGNECAEGEKLKGNMAMIFGGAFLLNRWSRPIVLRACSCGPTSAAKYGALAGLAAGLCWVATSFGINYLFERRPLGLWLINGGYHTLQVHALRAGARGDGRERLGDTRLCRGGTLCRLPFAFSGRASIRVRRRC